MDICYCRSTCVRTRSAVSVLKHQYATRRPHQQLGSSPARVADPPMALCQPLLHLQHGSHGHDDAYNNFNSTMPSATIFHFGQAKCYFQFNIFTASIFFVDRLGFSVPPRPSATCSTCFSYSSGPSPRHARGLGLANM
jgi:hypothetical protein